MGSAIKNLLEQEEDDPVSFTTCQIRNDAELNQELSTVVQSDLRVRLFLFLFFALVMHVYSLIVIVIEWDNIEVEHAKTVVITTCLKIVYMVLAAVLLAYFKPVTRALFLTNLLLNFALTLTFSAIHSRLCHSLLLTPLIGTDMSQLFLVSFLQQWVALPCQAMSTLSVLVQGTNLIACRLFVAELSKEHDLAAQTVTMKLELPMATFALVVLVVGAVTLVTSK